MANTKGQGLPLSFIVIAAISALVLILVIAFTIGGLGGFFKQITIAGGGSDLSTVQSACQNACNTAQLSTSSAQFKSSDYCTKTYAIDLNKDGKITSGNETGLHCWYAKDTIKGGITLTGGPGIDCTVQIGNDVYTGSLNCTV
jgi:hypothetical protein